MNNDNNIIVMVLVVVLTTNITEAEVVYYESTRHYYEAIFVPEPGVTWPEASLSASSKGGSLVSITSEDENSFVYSLVSDDYFWHYLPTHGDFGLGPWIGGYQLPDSNEPDEGWSWIDGEDWCFSNWGPGQPTNSSIPEGKKQDHLHFYGYRTLKGKIWNDNYFGEKMLGYIVEYNTYVPKLLNIYVMQRDDDSKLIDVFYDLLDEDSDNCTVSIEVSDDGGSIGNVPATSFTGDIGLGITPGQNKHIVWDACKDLPGVYGENFKIRVIADDEN